MTWQLNTQTRRPRPGYERLRELAVQELRCTGHRHGELMPVTEIQALLCRASQRLLAERLAPGH